ncbi:hypothetical protein D3C78_1049650 [compost metagenome]
MCESCIVFSRHNLSLSEGDFYLDKGFMGGFYKITEWIMRIAGSNLLWLICSLPFMLAAGTKFLLFINSVPGAENEFFTYIAMAILAPFVFFPATSALFSVTRKWVMGETDLSIIKVYFKGYKENYKQSMIGGIFYTLLVVVMVFDYNVYMKQLENMQMIGIIILIFLIIVFVSLFNFFSMVAHYHMKTTLIIKNAILLTIIKPFRMLTTVICTAVLLFLTLKYGWLILFGLGSLTALVAYFNFNVAYNKIQEKVDKMNADKNGEESNAEGDSSEELLELESGEQREKE